MKKIKLQDIRKQDYRYREAIKTLCANVQFAGKDIRSILLTSCFPNEGKSDIAFSLSQELGSIGKKTLLLDADIRNSAFMSRFQVNQKVLGLSELLSGQASFQDVIFKTNYPGLNMIFAGRTAPNSSGLLASETFKELVSELRNYYDYVIIDSPPIATIIDAAVIAENVDGAIMIIESEAVSYKTAQKAMAQLQVTGCQVIGGVLNKVDPHKGEQYYRRYGYYYKYGRYGGYGGYGAYGKEDKAEDDAEEDVDDDADDDFIEETILPKTSKDERRG